MKSKQMSIASATSLHFQSDGHRIDRNQWFKIGLGDVELAALKVLHKRLWKKPKIHKLSETLRLLFIAAMAHHDLVWPRLEADCAAMRALNGLFVDCRLDEVIRQKFNLTPAHS